MGRHDDVLGQGWEASLTSERRHLSAQQLRWAPKSPFHGEMLRARINELKSHIPIGGIREVVVRSARYIGIGRGSVDERGFEMVRRIRAAQEDMPALRLPTSRRWCANSF